MISAFRGIRGERRLFYELIHFRMSWIQHQINQKDGILAYPPPVSPSFTPPYMHKDITPSSSGTRISPAVLFIIVILAFLFFVSGILHLLIKYLIKHQSFSTSSPNNDNTYPEMSESDALQRQLQQLFHLHDSGLEQAFIDALPIFLYKEIVGLKDPFDCAVCLCEFSEKDKLRLLPLCSHAFHINCIDTWLLSNSSCPLCRATLFCPDFATETPMFDFDNSRADDGFHGNGEIRLPSSQKIAKIDETRGVLPVRLGNLRRLNGEAGKDEIGETSSSKLDARRCFSMGSYQYVVGDLNLQVDLSNERDGCNAKLVKRIEHNGNPSIVVDLEGKKISNASKGDSYSVSKVWLWSKKGKFTSNTEMGVSSSLHMDLPWMGRAQGT